MITLLARFAAAFGIAATVENVAARLQRGVMVAIIAAMAGCFAIAALGCAVAALWIFALPKLGPAGAPLAAAAALLLVSLALLAVAARRARPAPPVAPLHTQGEDMLAATSRAFREQDGPALLAALATSVIAAAVQRAQRPPPPPKEQSARPD